MSGEQQRKGIFRRDEEYEGNGPGGAAMSQQSGGEVTVVGAGARLEGNVVSGGSLRVDGQVKGRIDAEGDVVLSPQSSVEADIKAANVTVAGRFKGDIVVKGRVELAGGGRIDGNVTSKSLVIQEGGIFCGQSVMDQQAPKPATPGSGAMPSAAPGASNAQAREAAATPVSGG